MGQIWSIVDLHITRPNKSLNVRSTFKVIGHHVRKLFNPYREHCHGDERTLKHHHFYHDIIYHDTYVFIFCKVKVWQIQ